jgi:RHS repeat-associated protein
VRYKFTAQREEATLGLYDYRARFYNPLLGRFISYWK